MFDQLGQGIKAYIDAYGESSPEQQGAMISKILTDVVVDLCLTKGLVSAVKLKKVASLTAKVATLTGTKLKYLKIFILTKADDIFNDTRRILASEGGYLRFETTADDVIEISEDVLKTDIIEGGLTPSEADEVINTLKKATTEDITRAMDQAMDNARANGVTDNMAIIRVGDAVAEADAIIKNLTNIGNFNSSSVKHILQGEINATGKAVGFHYEGMPYSGGKVILGTTEAPNGFGVYRAKVEVDGIAKTANGGYSTFFPKDMTSQQVIDSINEAFANKIFVIDSVNTYRGTCSRGFEIDMYIDATGKIISSFPNMQ